MEVIYRKKYTKIEKINYSSLNLKIAFLDERVKKDKHYKLFDQISAYEIPPTGDYSAGGISLSGLYYDLIKKIVFADNIVVYLEDATFKFMVIYEPTQKYLACMFSFAETQHFVNTRLNIIWNSEGVYLNSIK